MLLGMGWITYYLMGMLPLAWHGMAWHGRLFFLRSWDI